MPLTCPVCRRINPDNWPQCECGYDFVRRTGGKKDRRPVAFRIGAAVFFVSAAVLLYVLISLWHESARSNPVALGVALVWVLVPSIAGMALGLGLMAAGAKRPS